MTPEQFLSLGAERAALYAAVSVVMAVVANHLWTMRRMTRRIVDGDGNGGASLSKVVASQERIEARQERQDERLGRIERRYDALACVRPKPDCPVVPLRFHDLTNDEDVGGGHSEEQ